MSANNWTTCPRCKGSHTKKETELAAQYGKIPADEWMKKNAVLGYLKDTLREDWELGTHDGAFRISYSCSCNVCGLSFQYDHSELVQ